MISYVLTLRYQVQIRLKVVDGDIEVAAPALVQGRARVRACVGLFLVCHESKHATQRRNVTFRVPQRRAEATQDAANF